MRAIALRSLLLVLIVLALPACRRRYVVETSTTTSSSGVVSGGGDYAGGGGGGGGGGVVATGSFQLLYLPAASLPLHLLSYVHVETTDGRVFDLGPADLAQVASGGGRIAVRIPAGVTTGTATIYLNDGRTFVTTFHIAVSSGSATLGALAPGSDTRCYIPNGTWVGTISDTPGSRSTVSLEVLGDCRTVRGFVHLDTPDGSVDSTIEGTWDVGSGVLVARDTQLFNIVIRPGGGGFCPTDEYRLQLAPDGNTIYGQNIIYGSSCAGTSQVYLQRTR